MKAISAREIKTVEQAQALPEVDDPFFELTKEIQLDGTKRFTYRPRPLCGDGIDGDSIFSFVDTDGCVMDVIETENGAAKTPFM